MVTFKCRRSGNTVSFTLPDDIESMRKHEGYEEVKTEKKQEEQKLRGRPRKEG